MNKANKPLKKKSTKCYNRRAIYNNPNNNNTIWSQGTYNVRDKNKCINGAQIQYKSSLECKFAYELDIKRKNVVKWGYETLTIGYRGPDKKAHIYYIDFVFDVIKPNGAIQKYLVEIKPEQEKIEIEEYWKKKITPKKHGGMKAETWRYKINAFLTNVAKWNSAKEYALKKGYIFLVITEKDLKIK